MQIKPSLVRTTALSCALAVSVLSSPTFAVRQAKERAPDANAPAGAPGAEKKPSEGDFAAGRLLEKANELLSAGEDDRGVKILETVIEQYPSSPVRYKAYLALGKHYLAVHDQVK